MTLRRFRFRRWEAQYLLVDYYKASTCSVTLHTVVAEDAHLLFESHHLPIRNVHGSCMFGHK